MTLAPAAALPWQLLPSRDSTTMWTPLNSLSHQFSIARMQQRLSSNQLWCTYNLNQRNHLWLNQFITIDIKCRSNESQFCYYDSTYCCENSSESSRRWQINKHLFWDRLRTSSIQEGWRKFADGAVPLIETTAAANKYICLFTPLHTKFGNTKDSVGCRNDRVGKQNLFKCNHFYDTGYCPKQINDLAE